MSRITAHGLRARPKRTYCPGLMPSPGEAVPRIRLLKSVAKELRATGRSNAQSQ